MYKHIPYTINKFLSIFILKAHLQKKIKVDLILFYTKIYWQALSAIFHKPLNVMSQNQ